MESADAEGPRSYGLSLLETPWLRLHVETHLIFGPIARHIPMGWVLFGTLFVLFIHSLFNPYDSLLPYMNVVMFGGSLLFVPFLMLKWPRFHQAAIGWIAVKSVLAFAAFLFILTAGPISLMRGQSDALPNFLLGFIWLPWPEFLPKVTPHQKWVTLTRMMLTVPVAYLGIRSGYWH